jgi:hypothetical protein
MDIIGLFTTKFVHRELIVRITTVIFSVYCKYIRMLQHIKQVKYYK